jgi:hypothetical protein
MKRVSTTVPFLILSLWFVACTTGETKTVQQTPQVPQVNAANEMAALGRLRSLASAEARFNLENGRYGTLDELIRENHVSDPSDGRLSGYRFDIRVTPSGFEITAVPERYGISGKRSFYTDESNVLRAADKNGAPATSLDPEA